MAIKVGSHFIVLCSVPLESNGVDGASARHARSFVSTLSISGRSSVAVLGTLHEPMFITQGMHSNSTAHSTGMGAIGVARGVLLRVRKRALSTRGCAGRRYGGRVAAPCGG